MPQHTAHRNKQPQPKRGRDNQSIIEVVVIKEEKKKGMMNNIKFFSKRNKRTSFFPQPKKSIEDRVHLDIIIKKAKRKKERKEGKGKTEKIKETVCIEE